LTAGIINATPLVYIDSRSSGAQRQEYHYATRMSLLRSSKTIAQLCSMYSSSRGATFL